MSERAEVPTKPADDLVVGGDAASEVVITDQMRTPDERVKVQPFRHPWIKGTDTDPECGRTWRDHGWIDRGDHGFTVCPTEAERPDVTEARTVEPERRRLCQPGPEVDAPSRAFEGGNLSETDGRTRTMSDLELRKVIREAIQPTRTHGEAIDAIAAALTPLIEALAGTLRGES